MFSRLASGWIFTASRPVSSNACLAAASQTSREPRQPDAFSISPPISPCVSMRGTISAASLAGKQNAHL